ncbi:MAG: polysaccharide deacetylase family protein [Chlamydiia bacterium]|nr:polysaccharide deacetylase family protein [Chlamydiia bacterium]
MLIALLYHKIGTSKYANPLPLFESHLKWIADHYPTTLPGDTLRQELQVCLTFDDAYFDFYHLIFPLLEKYHLKALLAVPTAFIPESTPLSPEKRLEKVHLFSEKAPPLPSPAFCTWEELKILNDSPLIQIASHSVHHHPLTASQIDPEHELFFSKQILESKLKTPIQTFVYPYGRFSSKVHALAKKHYPYVMRIGNALNYSWTNFQGLCYRINADQLPHPQYPFSLPKHLKHTARLLLNALRKK